jgi:hypothetical protein
MSRSAKAWQSKLRVAFDSMGKRGLHFMYRSATIAALTASPGEVTGG